MDLDDNPFRAPGAGVRGDLLDDDRAARTARLGAEARLIAVGTLWMIAAALQLAFTAPMSLFAMGMAVFGGGDGALELLIAGGFYAVGAFILYWYFTIGRDLRALKSVAWGDVRLWALLGVCCGPCSAVNLVIPFLILRRDAAAVLTPEHAALRERTPDLTPPTTATLLMIVGGFASVMFALTLAMIVGVAWLGAALGKDIADFGQKVPVEAPAED
jgi:hypothetical protein